MVNNLNSLNESFRLFSLSFAPAVGDSTVSGVVVGWLGGSGGAVSGGVRSIRA